MSRQSSPSVLFVDDDGVNRHALSLVLQSAGFDPCEAGSGTEALRMAAADHRPDLIVLDVNLPDVDGFEVCRRIKAHPATSAIPVLHLSGTFVTPQDRARALEGGADAYLTKPVEPRELVAACRALLRLRKAEEQAKQASRQWQSTFDAVHDGLGLLGPDGRLLRCNQALAQLLGRPAEQALEQPVRELLWAALGEAGDAIAERLLGPMATNLELYAGGRWFRVTVGPLPAEAVAPGGRVFLLAEVTARKALEDQLRQAQKMEAVGRLAGGIAHDFNNLLTGVLGNLELAQRELPAGHPAIEPVRTAEQAAWRAAGVTGQLLGFSRQAPLQPRALDLGPYVRETVTLLARTVRGAVQIQTRVAGNLWPVLADPTQVGQVLMNLVLNARDAMPHGGWVIVEADNVSVDAEQARKAAAGNGRTLSYQFVRLRVSDTGCGMSEEVRARVFDPFFTTKGPGEGTGLGLAVVHGIAAQHGGWVECDSRPGQGACFAVFLPRYRRGDESNCPHA
jgi:PAS domain S-box-containing protein